MRPHSVSLLAGTSWGSTDCCSAAAAGRWAGLYPYLRLGWAGLGWDTPNTFLPLATIWPPPASSVTSVRWVAWLTGDRVYPVWRLRPATRHLASVSGLVTEVRVTRLGGGPAVLLPLDHVHTQCCMLGLGLCVPSTNTTLLSPCSAQVCRWQHSLGLTRQGSTRPAAQPCPALLRRVLSSRREHAAAASI